ncbi:MAG: hypothetical protein KGS47_02540 [Chloroflexi bacterium]|nr:hypothetical protein [Chloroflexota bacterium]
MITRQATLFGLRVHVTITPRGVPDTWLPTSAAVHDSQAMPALFDQARDRAGIGDRSQPDGTCAGGAQRRGGHTTAARQCVTCTLALPAFWHQFNMLSAVFDIQRPHARSLKSTVCHISTRVITTTLFVVTQPLIQFCTR